LHYYNYEFTSDDVFSRSVSDIYTTDDIDPNKVRDVKIRSLLGSPLRYTYFKFCIADPDFRRKGATGADLSRVVERIKRGVRSDYRKSVPHYVHDVIIHISDNPAQARDIDAIMGRYRKHRKREFVSLKHFLRCNFRNGVFERADVLVRKRAIEQYLEDESHDFAAYRRMQAKRTGRDPAAFVRLFKGLVKSLLGRGFDAASPVNYSGNYLLRDGAHRLGYLYLRRQLFIPVASAPWDGHGTYSIDWFRRAGFPSGELDAINVELDQLKKYISVGDE
jgi:hypothetical protein